MGPYREPCEHAVCCLVSAPRSPRCANPVAVQCSPRLLGVVLARVDSRDEQQCEELLGCACKKGSPRGLERPGQRGQAAGARSHSRGQKRWIKTSGLSLWALEGDWQVGGELKKEVQEC